MMSPHSYMYYIENNYVKTIRAVIGDVFFGIGPEFASEWHQFWILAQS